MALGLTLILGGALLLDGGDAEAGPAKRASGGTEIMPLDQIKPGMKGYAVTVFKGTESDRFNIEVVDIVPDFQPGMDAVLFRSDDPRLMHTGIVGGMSGSPIYIEGKLAGALAYGWAFNKDPLGGMTPIESMLEIDKLPYRPDVLPTNRAKGRKGNQAWADQMLGLDTDPRPARGRPYDQVPGSGMEALGAPMALGGFGPRTAAFLGDATGLVPARGGGGGGTKATKEQRRKWKGGDSVSVILIGGDNSAAPNGTVTWVGGPNDSHLLAFGHPMFGGGPSSYPISSAKVHTILPSVQRSVKLSSALYTQGTLIQDRQPAISLRTDIEATTIPVSTDVKSPDDQFPDRHYDSFVAESPFLTPSLAASLLLQGLEEAASDAVELTAVVDHEIAITTSKGPRTIKLTDETFFPTGVAPGPIARSRAILVLSLLLDNQFEVGEIRSIKQTARVTYGAPVEIIESITLKNGEIRAGDLATFELELREPRTDVRRIQELAVRIPDDAGGEELQITIAGGDYELPYMPPPRDLDALIDNVVQVYPSRSIIASVYSPNEGLATEDGLLDDLPGSVLETLSTEGKSRKPLRYKRLARRVVKTNSLIEGSHKIKIDVLPKRLSDQD